MIRTITVLCLALFVTSAWAQYPLQLATTDLKPHLASAKAAVCGTPTISSPPAVDAYPGLAAIAGCFWPSSSSTNAAGVLAAAAPPPDHIGQRSDKRATPTTAKAIIELDFANVRIIPGGAPNALAVPTQDGARFQGDALSLYTDHFAQPKGKATYVQSSTGIAIKAVREPITGTQYDKSKHQRAYRSAWLSTRGMTPIRKGDTITFKLRVPHVKGTVPAVWLMPISGKWPPELDLLEFFQRRVGDDTIHTTQITAAAQPWTIKDNFWRVLTMPAGFDQANWHVYSFTWGDRIRATVDGQQVYDEASIMPDEPMYLIYSNAVGLMGMGEPVQANAIVAEMAWLKVTR